MKKRDQFVLSTALNSNPIGVGRWSERTRTASVGSFAIDYVWLEGRREKLLQDLSSSCLLWVVIWWNAYWLNLVGTDGIVFGSQSCHNYLAALSLYVMALSQIISRLALPSSQCVHSILSLDCARMLTDAWCFWKLNVSLYSSLRSWMDNSYFLSLRPLVEAHSGINRTSRNLIWILHDLLKEGTSGFRARGIEPIAKI